MQKVVLKLEGLHCQNCVNSVTNALKKIAGISDLLVTVSSLECNIDNNLVNLDLIKNTITDLGFDVV